MEIVSSIVNNPLFGFVSFLIGLVSLILAIIFYLNGKKSKRLAYTIKSFNLVKDYSERVPNIQVLYAGKAVQNLTISRVAFWNSGSDALYGSDIARADPLRVTVLTGQNVLDKKILKVTNPANQVSFSSPTNGSDDSIITFDFLNKSDGAVIQIVHTGLSGEGLILAGQIKGGGSPVFQQRTRIAPKSLTSKERVKRFSGTLAQGAVIFVIVALGIIAMPSWGGFALIAVAVPMLSYLQ